MIIFQENIYKILDNMAQKMLGRAVFAFSDKEAEIRGCKGRVHPVRISEG